MGRVLLLVGLPALFMGACIAVEDSRAEFCRNADEQRRSVICEDVEGTSGPGKGSDGSCTQAAQCTTPPGQCYEATGTCVDGKCEYSQKQAGASCGDATPPGACHASSGTCEAGVCRAGYKPRGSSCEDGQLCTVNDTCDGAGTCVGGGPRACTNPPAQCYEPTGTCANDTCSYKLKAAGASCDDGNPCTVSDQCNSAGICAGTAKVCNAAPGQCYQYEGTCDSQTGRCIYAPQPGGTACSPDNRCETGACNGAGECVTTGTVSCNNTACERAISCEPSTGCVYDDWCSRSGGQCVDNCCRDSTYGYCMAN
jgi:hypothetical protein